jgi:ribosomal protein S18 acetylase RimI-like enzyme
MHIRKFQPEDYDTIKKMTQDSFDGVSIDQQLEKQFGLINNKDWQWRLAKQVEQDVNTDPDGIFVMIDDGQIIGWISSLIDHETKIGHVPHMAVRKNDQEKGIGRQLIIHVLNLFRENGMSHVQIETLVQNEAANALYQSIGFQDIANKIYYAMEFNNPRSGSESDNKG